MTNHILPIQAFDRDKFLQAFHPNLADIVHKWMYWCCTNPEGHPPFDTTDLIALCRQVLVQMFPMWPSALDYYGFTEEDLQ